LYHLWEERGGKQIFHNENYQFSQNDEDDFKDDKTIEQMRLKHSWFRQLFDNANLVIWRRELQVVITENIETVWAV
jgi:hypothetical protein